MKFSGADVVVFEQLTTALATWVKWQMPLMNRPRVVRSMPPGNSHRSYLVSGLLRNGRHKLFVLRIESDASRALAMLKAQEILSMERAGSLAPQLVFSNETLLVTEFVQAPRWRPPENLKLLGKSLRRLHERSPHTDTVTLNLCDHCTDYRDRIGLKGEDQELFSRALKHLERVSGCYGESCLCHNDLNPGNVLVGNTRVTFIDWEYSAVNSPWFDLASLTEYGSLTHEQTISLCRAYDPGDDFRRCAQAVADYRAVVRLVEWLWLLLLHPDAAPGCRRRLNTLTG